MSPMSRYFEGSPLCASAGAEGLNGFGMGHAGFVSSGQIGYIGAAVPHFGMSQQQLQPMLAPMAFPWNGAPLAAGAAFASSTQTYAPSFEQSSQTQMMLVPMASIPEVAGTSAQNSQMLNPADTEKRESIALPLSQMLATPQVSEQKAEDTGSSITATDAVAWCGAASATFSSSQSNAKVLSTTCSRFAKKDSAKSAHSHGPKAVFVDLSKLRPSALFPRGGRMSLTHRNGM